MKNSYRHVCVYAMKLALCGLMGAFAVSCKDDILSDTYGPPGLSEGRDYVLVELPGYMGVQLHSVDGNRTRSEESSDGKKFHDGILDEYALAPGNGYHFVVLFGKNSSDTSKPVCVIPLSGDNLTIEDDEDRKDPATEETIYDNLTRSVYQVAVGKDMTPAFDEVNTIREMLDGAEAYALVNLDYTKIRKADGSNPSIGKTALDVLTNLTRKEFMELSLTDYKLSIRNSSSTTDYFTMTNAVYLSNDANLKKQYNYTVDNSKVAQSSDRVAIKDPAIKIAVERLAVKYSVEFPDGVLNGNDEFVSPLSVEQFTEVKYKDYGYSIESRTQEAYVKVVGFSVNGIEQSEKAFKYLADGGTYYMSGSNRLWNDYTNTRSYWTEDNNYRIESYGTSGTKKYGAKGYPHQFRASLDRDSVLSYHDGATYENYREGVSIGTPKMDALNASMVLGYRSFEEMKFPESKLRASWSDPFYSMENTYVDPGMTGGTWAWPWEMAPYVTATNVVLLCQLHIEGVNEGTTLYLGQNNIFYTSEESLLSSKLEILNRTMLNAGNAGMNVLHCHWSIHSPNLPGEDNTQLYKIAWPENSVLWVMNPDDPHTVPGQSNTYNAREATWEDLTLIPAEIAGGDGKGLIAPKYPGSDVHYYIAPIKTNEEGQPVDRDGNVITDDNMDTSVYAMLDYDYSDYVELHYDHLIGLIHKIIGPVDIFTQGYMVYSKPITHNSAYLIDSSTPASQKGTRNYSWKTLGDIGVVRNNWYNITIDGVSGLGKAVHDLSQPIVPLLEIYRDYMHTRIQVLDWHTIRQEDIPLM